MAAALLMETTVLPAQPMKSRSRCLYRYVHMAVVVALLLKRMTLVIAEVAEGPCQRRLPVAKLTGWCVSLAARIRSSLT